MTSAPLAHRLSARLAPGDAARRAASVAAAQARQGGSAADAERRGLAGLARPPGPLVWLHGASVGEAVALLPFVERITRVGRDRARDHEHGHVGRAARRSACRPARCINTRRSTVRSSCAGSHALAPRRGAGRGSGALAEHDRRSQALGIAARDDQRADQRAVVPPLAQGAALHRRAARAISTSASRAARTTASGSPRSARRTSLVAGDIKFDAPALPADRRELAELSGLTSGRQIWIAASTHEGEEMIAAAAHQRLARVFPDALTLIAPRHPERGEAILRQLEAQGLICALRSRGEAIRPETAVYICDTIGELGLFYRLAGVVFVGKSFVGGRRAESDRARAARLRHSARADGRQFRRRLRGARQGGRRARHRASRGPRRGADRAVRQRGAAARDGARGRRRRSSAGPARSTARCGRSPLLPAAGAGR